MPVGKESRRHARHPAADSSRAAIGAALPAAASPAAAPQSPEDASAEAGQHFVGANAAGVDRRTQKEQRVVDHLAGARLEIDGRDPFVLGKIQRQDDVAIQIGAVRRHVDRSRERQHGVRPAERPPFGEGWRRWRRGEISCGHAAIDPRLQRASSSASDRRRSSRNSSNPGAAIACHGGMYRRAVTLTINSPRFFTSSYDSSGNGAAWPGR